MTTSQLAAVESHIYINLWNDLSMVLIFILWRMCYVINDVISNTRYHGVELGQVSCGKQTFGCGI